MERRHRRRRPARFCLECRRRKIKCDRANPCKHCVSADAQCTYSPYGNKPVLNHQLQQSDSRGSTTSASTHPTSPFAETRQPVSEHRSDLLRDPGEESVAAAPVMPGKNDTASALGRNDIQLPDRARDVAPNLHDLLRRVEKLERSSSCPAHRESEDSGAILAHEFGQTSQIVLNKTRLLGRSHYMGNAQEFVPIMACLTEVLGNPQRDMFQDDGSRALITQIRHLLQKCKDIAKVLKITRPSRGIPSSELDLTPPCREKTDRMVTHYLESFESTYRIVHIPTFWSEYQRYWDCPESASIGIRLKVLLVSGIGSRLYAQGDADAGIHVPQWIHAAQMWLSGPLEKDRLNITGLQIYCLTIIARQVFALGGDLIWMSVGSLIRRAMQIGLHRDPKHFPAMPALQAELRRRLWATILELALQASLDAAMPPRISFDDFDTEPPSNNNDDEIASDTSPRSHPKTTYTATSIQLILLDSFATRLRIVQLLNNLRSEPSYLDVLALSSEITDACRASSNFMKENANLGPTPFHRNLLDYLLRRFIIPLHCPFALNARTNPLYHCSLKVSLDTALTLISPEPDDGFSRLMTIGGGLFREGMRYASTAICLELIAQVQAQSLDSTLKRNCQHKESLEKAMESLMKLSEERIRQEETNVKGYMFLGMVSAHAKAIEAGDSCELKIVQAAKDSLEFCHGLLQARLDTALLPSSDTVDFTSADLNEPEDFGMNLDLGIFFTSPDFA